LVTDSGKRGLNSGMKSCPLGREGKKILSVRERLRVQWARENDRRKDAFKKGRKLRLEEIDAKGRTTKARAERRPAVDLHRGVKRGGQERINFGDRKKYRKEKTTHIAIDGEILTTTTFQKEKKKGVIKSSLCSEMEGKTERKKKSARLRARGTKFE